MIDSIGVAIHRLARRLAPWGLPALCFLPYPLALIFPFGGPLQFRYDIGLPVVLWSSLIALGALAGSQLRRCSTGPRQLPSAWFARPASRQAMMAVVWLGVAALVFYWRLKGSSIAAIVEFAGLLVIPLYLAVASRRALPRQLPMAFGLLWLVHVLHGLQQLAAGQEMLAIVGNRNWAGAMIVALAPWPWLVLAGRWRDWRWRVVFGVLLAAIVGLLAWQASCRAVYLVAGFYFWWFVLLAHGRRWWRWTMLAASAALLLGICLLQRDRLYDEARRDVRPPMWMATLKMAWERPLAGVGPGQFRRQFVRYRLPAQMRTVFAAPVTEHPHNELLHVAAVGGLPLAALWGCLAALLLRRPRRGPFWQAAHFSAFILVGAAMFDLTLFMPATGLVGLFMLGLHLRSFCRWRLVPACPPVVAGETEAEGRESACAVGWPCPAVRRLCRWAFVALALWQGGVVVANGWQVRQANLHQVANQPELAHRCFLQAWSILPQDVESLYKAAETALVGLRNPQLCLEHWEQLTAREPDLAHINGLAAFAFEQLAMPGPALALHLHEAELFPYEVAIQARTLERCLAARRFEAALQVRSRLAMARWNRLVNQLGSQRQADAWVADFRQTVIDRRPEQAVELANRMLTLMPPQSWSEQPWSTLAAEHGLATDMCRGGFAGAECPYWLQALLAATLPTPDLPAGPASLETAARKVLACATRPGRPAGAIEVAEAFRLAGWLAAAIEIDGETTNLVELRWSHWPALLALPDTLLPGRSAADLADPETWSALGQPPSAAPASLTMVVPARSADFCTRNQILGDLLRRGQATGRPVLGESPTLTFQLHQELARQPAEPPAVPLDWRQQFR